MSKKVLVLSLSFLAVACASKLQPRSTGLSKPVATEIQLRQLKGASDSQIQSVAQAGDMGACRIVQTADSGCSSGQSYSVFLTDKKVYYPGMQDTAATGDPATSSSVCLSDAGKLAKQAFSEGFCFANNPVNPADLNAQAAVRKAMVQDFGQCVVKKTADVGCSNAKTVDSVLDANPDVKPDSTATSFPMYAVFLKDKKVFFPTMSATSDDLKVDAKDQSGVDTSYSAVCGGKNIEKMLKKAFDSNVCF
jgi:hypothetical protein